MNTHDPAHGGKAPRRSRIAFWVIAAVAAYFLLVEHREHVFAFLPIVLILLCPLMHMFHHHGQGGHGHGGAIDPDPDSRKTDDPTRASDHHHH